MEKRNAFDRFSGSGSALAPVVDLECQVIVLGSMPGRTSLARKQYYAHPQNAFWPIVLPRLAPLPTAQDETEGVYVAKLNLLRQANIGLWDVLADCDRSGSLDSKIAHGSEVFNPLYDFIDELPHLRAILFNGQKAQSLFDRRFKALRNHSDWSFYTMPSTSPAHASMSRNEKSTIWNRTLDAHLR